MPRASTRGTSSAEGLLALLQISDSAFPSGTFTHSFGLEQLVRDGFVRGPVELEAFVMALLRQSSSMADVVAMRRAWRCADEGDVEGVVDADRAYLRTKTAPELRAASLATGRRLIEETAAHVEDPLLQSYAARLREDRRLGVQPVAFGVAGRVLDVREDDAASALLQTTASAILQASMRLLPVSHRDVQGILHRLRPQIAAMISELPPVETGGIVETSNPGTDEPDQATDLAMPRVLTRGTPLRSFHPLQEIASLRHARGNARLFSS